ncbi:hypothetical protein E2C01_019704 [Portunus trituberculatus]|uniref:Uncharacterized protein n=1 Tax=Portunus trituberculatus TaxID=210409 RepID=A0A5B7DXZ1_PORTR|nr:hypothetical protein [Portunus trituberculatus]
MQHGDVLQSLPGPKLLYISATRFERQHNCQCAVRARQALKGVETRQAVQSPCSAITPLTRGFTPSVGALLRPSPRGRASFHLYVSYWFPRPAPLAPDHRPALPSLAPPRHTIRRYITTPQASQGRQALLTGLAAENSRVRAKRFRTRASVMSALRDAG